MDISFQYAHNSHEEFETRRDVNSEEVLIAFDKFDWEAQVAEADKTQKCSPTISVVISQDILVWVSAYNKSGNILFVSESRFPGEVNSWFGFSNILITKNLRDYQPEIINKILSIVIIKLR